jgi:hypothetical protein
MLSTGDIALGVAGLALLLSIYAVLYARAAVAAAIDEYDAADRRAPSLKHVAALQTELTELKDSYDTVITSLKKLRSRVGMRELRDRGEVQPDGMPPSDSPDWKKQARIALAKAGKLNAKFHTS